jgi:hypothetical protein
MFEHQNPIGEVFKVQIMLGAIETRLFAVRSNASRPNLHTNLMAELLHAKHNFTVRD